MVMLVQKLAYMWLIQFSSKESTLYTKKRVMYVSSFNRFLSIPLTDHKLWLLTWHSVKKFSLQTSKQSHKRTQKHTNEQKSTKSLRYEWTPHILLRLAAAALNVYFRTKTPEKTDRKVSLWSMKTTQKWVCRLIKLYKVCVNKRNTVNCSPRLIRLDAETSSVNRSRSLKYIPPQQRGVIRSERMRTETQWRKRRREWAVTSSAATVNVRKRANRHFKTLHKIYPCKALLSKFMDIDKKCYFNKNEEDLAHLFYKCDLSKKSLVRF